MHQKNNHGGVKVRVQTDPSDYFEYQVKTTNVF